MKTVIEYSDLLESGYVVTFRDGERWACGGKGEQSQMLFRKGRIPKNFAHLPRYRELSYVFEEVK